MNLNVNELVEGQKYQLLYELDHHEITIFAQKEFKKRNIFTVFYFFINAIFLGCLGFFVALDLLSGTTTWSNVLAGLGLGIFLSFSIIIIIHELLHVLAYKIVGAKQTAIKADWKKLIFVAVADKFVTNSKEFYFIALLPFVVITTVFLIGFSLVSNTYWFYVILGASFMHTAACGGDFALLGYFWENRHKQILTYDDVPAKKSYFYQSI